jgi:ABC-type glycerol-3-phosphate transport system substrate-binding protein
MKKNKLFLVFAAMIVVAMIFSACGSETDAAVNEPADEATLEEVSDEPVNIKFTLWGSETTLLC